MGETKELTAAGGVEQQAATAPGKEGAGTSPAQTVPAGGVAAAATTTEGAPAIAEEKKVDLTQSEEFRRWQAARDRREAQLQTQLAELRQQVGETQQRFEQAQLANADPEQVAQYYQNQVQALRGQQEQQQAAAAERAAIVGQAEQLLKELELDPNTPGLEWGEEPSWDGLARLATSAAKVKSLQAQQLAKENTTVAAEAAQAAKVEALKAAGVTHTTTGTGAASTGENPIAEITDPDALLKMGLGGGGRGQ